MRYIGSVKCLNFALDTDGKYGFKLLCVVLIEKGVKKMNSEFSKGMKEGR